MTPARVRAGRRTAAGFSLVEVLMVAVIVGIAAVGVARVQGNLFGNYTVSKDIQVRTALTQECAEEVLGTRRFADEGYEVLGNGGFGTNLCGSVTALSGYTIPSVTFTDYTGAGCPTNGVCKTASISQAGMTAVTIMLVDY